ncbi:hypothetical protein GYA19_00040 [Candidatus Beckwithbacteria bacterium]|nr:hypothetical protein [Candidatus Beckwithbacteria bacterium]
MHSYIISYQNAIDQNQLKEIMVKTLGLDLSQINLENNADIFNIYPEINEKTVNKTASIKIEKIRNLKNQVNTAALKLAYKIFLIWQADALTLAAQNSFLKLLEEPEEYVKIFLLTQNLNKLLPTIQSRCQIIRIQNTGYKMQQKLEDQEIEKFLALNLFEKLTFAEKLEKSREEALIFLKQLILYFRKQILKENTSQNIRKLKKTQTAYNDLSKNINLKLTIDNLMIEL